LPQELKNKLYKELVRKINNNTLSSERKKRRRPQFLDFGAAKKRKRGQKWTKNGHFPGAGGQQKWLTLMAINVSHFWSPGAPKKAQKNPHFAPHPPQSGPQKSKKRADSAQKRAGT